ncbi:MAG TPA: YciI family protein [Candidatus Kapabacteria bacterium]|nr:YciI family protein [Candidatus Kapabacteria bacterium]
MKFMVIVKANKDSESGRIPKTDEFAEMGKFNEELVKAGVMLMGEGLLNSSKGARVKFSGKNRSVSHGPFSLTNDLMAGFWVWKCGSLDEAIEWLKRAPFPEGEVEIRQIASAEDFGDNLTPELREQEARQSKKIAEYAN